MSPIGKPDPETGEVVRAGRHYGGGHGNLGNVGVWSCPGCGAKNTTDVNQGCPTCGAGKPGEARKVEPSKPTPQRPPVKPGHSRPPAARPAPQSMGSPELLQRGVPEGVVRVVRLVEYLIAPGKLQDGEHTLRRSLVGTTLFQWGQITATIVDELSARQEEILKLAKLQPGVWLGGPTADQQQGQSIREIVDMALTRPPAPKPTAATPPAPPPPAPEPIVVSDDIRAMAEEFVTAYGYRFCNTLALALSNVAEELKGNMEPNKFLDPDECLAFAQALMNAIPNEWEGDVDEGDGDTQDDSVRTQQNG